MLMELLFWQKPIGRPQCFFFVDNSRFINDSYEFGKMIVAHITLSHPCLVKIHKNVPEQLTSNTISADFPHALDFEALLSDRALAALFEYMQFVRILENITFCSLFTNCLRPFCDFNHHTVTSNNPPPPLLFWSKTCDAVLNSLSLSVLVMIFASFSDSFKCFHTADMFAEL